MKITTTNFESIVHNHQKAGNTNYGYYVYHNLDIWNTVKIDDLELTANYQTGNSFHHNDYDCPSNKLELSEDAGTASILCFIDNLYESDLETQQKLLETLEEAKDICPLIDTKEKLLQLFYVIRENQIDADNYLDSLNLSYEIEDYSENNDGTLTVK